MENSMTFFLKYYSSDIYRLSLCKMLFFDKWIPEILSTGRKMAYITWDRGWEIKVITYNPYDIYVHSVRTYIFKKKKLYIYFLCNVFMF